MGMLNICLELAADFDGFADTDVLEKNYQTVYKKLLTFLYGHPKFSFSFSFSGVQITYYAQRHPEVIKILSELTGRHQVEVLGGGYYYPIFPLLFPVDRSGQIEKLTSELRSTIGKRPRGISLFESIWDPSLVTTLQTCGMEYVQLNNTLIPKNKKCNLPLITSDQGKTIKILPVDNELVPDVNEKNDIWFSRIKKSIDRQCGDNKDVFPVVVIEFTVSQLARMIDTDWFEYVNDICTQESKTAEFTLPQNYLKTANSFIQSYIPAGMDWKIGQWAQKPYTCTENKSRFPVTIHDFLNAYTQSHQLYERMMYLSMLISQAHGDKIRKSAAREKLWEAQAGNAYVCSLNGIPVAAQLRQNAYKALNEAERLIRECNASKESITSFDYDGDGINEYICQMNKYNAVISNKAGSVVELDVIQSGGNYADSMYRMEQFDKIEDNYQRGLFVEHLFENGDKEKYIKQIPAGNGIFSSVQFTERKFESVRNEIQMEGKGEFSSLQQPVTLKKNYVITSNGFSIQYILKNESPLSLKGYLVVESNFAQTDKTADKKCQYDTELILNGERHLVKGDSNFNTNGGVSVLQITDTVNNTSFLFEPNEEAGFNCAEITFNRPDESGKMNEASHTFTTGLYWNVDLAAGMEMEKTINLSIVPAKKNKNKK